MSDVFVSYSRKDIAFAKILHEALKENKLDTWIDWQDIPPSTDWLAEVYEAIEQADVFVFIISDTSLASEVCGFEIAHAKKHNKRLIPIVIKDVEAGNVPKELAVLNWIFFEKSGEKFSNAMEDLVTAITIDQGWLKTHTRLENRALGWERKEQDRGMLLRGAALSEAETWLAKAAEKDPRPTALQTQYILKSREDSTRRQRITLSAVGFGFILSVMLGIFALTQRNVAIEEGFARATAQYEAEEESIMRATQQTIAEEQRDIAEEQKTIAESKGLAAFSLSNRSADLDLALLLAIEGLNKQINHDTKSALLHSIDYNSGIIRYLQIDELGDIYVVSVNSNTDQIAVSSGNNIIYILNLKTGEQQFPPIELVISEIYEIAYSPDGNLLAIGGTGGGIILLDPHNGTILANPLETPNQQVGNLKRIVFLDNSKIIALNQMGLNRDGNIFVWDLITSDLIEIIDVDLPFNFIVANSPDSNLLAVSNGIVIRIFNTETWDELNVIEGKSITSMSFNYDGKLLASGDYSGEVIVWDVKSGEKISKTNNFGDEKIYQVYFVSSSIILSADETYFRFWNYKTEVDLARYDYDGIFYKKNNIKLSQDRKILISGGTHGKITLFDIWANSPGRIPFSYEKFNLDFLKIMPTRNYVIGYATEDYSEENPTLDNQIIMWNIQTGEVVGEPINIGSHFLWDMEISPDGKYIAGLWDSVWLDSEFDEPITFWDIENGIKEEISARVLDLRIEYDSYEDFIFFPDGNRMGIITDNQYLLVLNYINSEIVTGPVKLNEEGNEYSILIMDKNGDFIIASEAGNNIQIYDSQTLEPIGQPFIGHQDTINAMDISPDKKYLISAGWDNNLILWDIKTKTIVKQITKLSRWDMGLNNVLFSPSGDYVVVQYDDVLQLFEVPTLLPIGPVIIDDIDYLKIPFEDTDPLLSYGGTFDPRDSLQFTPDGEKLFIGGVDNLYFINLNINSWLEQACFRAGRNLTEDEWSVYLPFEEYRKTCSNYP